VARTGQVFGYGLLITTIDQPRRRRAGSGSWGGIFNTRFWVDPAAGVTGLLFSNCLPHVEAGPADTLLALERMLYASL
jgi:methyl acetate hydrolase